MAAPGDRAVAGLLSALAEAPDFTAAASFFLTQLAEITRTSRACMLRLDSAHESLVLASATGFDSTLAAISIPTSDLSNPLVISTLSLSPVRGERALPVRGLAALTPWIALPLSQPRLRSPAEMISAQRGAELIGSSTIEVLPAREQRLGAAPAGVIVIEASTDRE